MNDIYTVLLTYDKDDLIVDDVIDCALLGICSEENCNYSSQEKKHTENL